MFDPILLAALFTTVVLGAALVRVLRSERRRANLEPLLSTMARTASSAEVQGFSLRRVGPQRSAVPTLLSSRLDLTFASTGNRIGPAHLIAAGIAAAAVTGLLSVASSVRPMLAIVLGVAAAAGAPALLLRSGLPAPEAIELVTHEVRPPVATEFRLMLDELRIGTEMDEALQRAADRIRVPDFRFFAVSLVLQRQTGGGIAETLSGLSGIIRQRKALRMKARALTAEAQASAAIIATMPFVAGVGLFVINRDLISVLFIDPRGRFLLGIAVASLLTGLAAMRALIKRNLR